MRKLNFKLHKRGLTALALGLILVIVVATVVPMVAAATTPQVTAYVNKLSGEVRITNIDGTSTASRPGTITTSTGWQQVTWNVQGSPGPAGPMAPSIIGGAGDIDQSSTRYAQAFADHGSSNEGNVIVIMPAAGTISKLYVYLDTAPGTSKSYTFTVRNNRTSTSVTCLISGSGTTGSDLINSVSFAAGDTIDIMVVPSAHPNHPNSANMHWSAVFTPTTE